MIITTYSAFRTLFAPAGGPLDTAGYPAWDASLLRKNNFAEPTGVPTPIVSFPFSMTCNGGAADGGAAYDWYLSQRTDDPDRQYLLFDQLSMTQSGSVACDLTALAVAALGLSGPTAQLNEDQLVRILKDVTVYCRRRSDESIQFVQMLPTTLGG